MKIAIYANEVGLPGNSGVKSYSIEIIKNLLKLDNTNQYFLYSSRDICKAIDSDRAKYITRPKKPFWAFSVFPKIIKNDGPDVVFIPLQIYPFLKRRGNKPKIVVTVHDVAFQYFPEHFTFIKRELLKFHTKRAIEHSDGIIVPSFATKRDILKFYKVNADKITVVYHGCDPNLINLADKRTEYVLNLTGKCPYILYVGSIQPRKNIIRLVKAFEKIKKSQEFANFKLVICGGKGWLYQKTLEEIEKSIYKEDIILTGSAENDVLASLYKNAEVFVLLSLYEGFGLPVLEAMSFGKPVVAADNSSLKEIVGDAGLLVDGSDLEDIENKLKSLLTSQSMKAELSKRSLWRAKDFSWEKSARETLSVLESVWNVEHVEK